jgi:hypothetical protein
MIALFRLTRPLVNLDNSIYISATSSPNVGNRFSAERQEGDLVFFSSIKKFEKDAVMLWPWVLLMIDEMWRVDGS